MNMYKSPICVFETVGSIATSIRKEKENYIYECVSRIGVDVNKEELMRALQYDRSQYEKGYSDGIAEGTETAIDKFLEAYRTMSSSFSIDERDIYMERIAEQLKVGEQECLD